jgi:predicted O-methyltransferase YrrM
MGPDFLRAAAELYEPLMGTEHVAPLLHSIVRMTRPRRVLEVGLGYTTLFLLDGLAKAAMDQQEDVRLLRDAPADNPRRTMLDAGLRAGYAPLLIGIDDFSLQESTSPKVLAAAQRLELAPLLKLMKGDFREQIPKIPPEDLPLDFIWFDCGGPREYIDFLALCWPLLSENHGFLALHNTYWPYRMAGRETEPVVHMLPGAILNEIKRQQASLGLNAQFEVLSLCEGYKSHQGSVTMVRKIPPSGRCRDQDLLRALNAAQAKGLERGFDLRKW